MLAVTDIIILSKSKKAPEGFTLAGEMHGLMICYKSAPLPLERSHTPSVPVFNNPTPLPLQTSQPLPSLPTVSLKPVSPSHTSANGNAKTTPVRPAPLPPKPNPPSTPSSPGSSSNHTLIISSSTLSGYTG